MLQDSCCKKIVLVAAVFLLCLPRLSAAAGCAATEPDASGVQGAPLAYGPRWFGSTHLAALLPAKGKWTGNGPENHYKGKFWWWREGFDAKIEPFPQLEVSAHLRDDPVVTAQVSRAASSSNSKWNAMLVIMRFPEHGCWQVSGQYDGEELIFMLSVGQEPPKSNDSWPQIRD